MGNSHSLLFFLVTTSSTIMGLIQFNISKMRFYWTQFTMDVVRYLNTLQTAHLRLLFSHYSPYSLLVFSSPESFDLFTFNSSASSFLLFASVRPPPPHNNPWVPIGYASFDASFIKKGLSGISGTPREVTWGWKI